MLYQEITDKNELKEYETFKFQMIKKGVIKVNDYEKIVYYTNYKYDYEYYYKYEILEKVLVNARQ